MRVLAVDDEALQLEKLEDVLYEALPNATIMTSRRPSSAITLVGENTYDIAFLDIQMRTMTGIELAARLKQIQPGMNIIFVTGFDEYKGDAMDLRASGYITKPVSAEKIQEELKNLRYPVADLDYAMGKGPAPVSGSGSAAEAVPLGISGIPEIRDPQAILNPGQEPVLYVQCFGNFDVFDAGHCPVSFERAKAKELFAYLIYRNGAPCSDRELAAVLYMGKDEQKAQDMFRNSADSLMKALRKMKAENAILKESRNYAVKPEAVYCDYFRFEAGDPQAKKDYSGEFMSQYSWAEEVKGYLAKQLP